MFKHTYFILADEC